MRSTVLRLASGLAIAVSFGVASVHASPARQGQGPLVSDGAPIMHHPTIYNIFWLPAGDTYQPDGASATDTDYENLMNQFVQDLGGTDYYNILTQYSDDSGAVDGTLTLGGSVVETRPYPKNEGTQDNPLLDKDIRNEVKREIKAQGWTNAPLETEYVVYTGLDVQSCENDPKVDNHAGCTFTDQNGYCGYHDAFKVKGSWTVYANEPDLSGGGCDVDDPTTADNSPNSDVAGDIQVNTLSHEIFESVTDPLDGGYVASDGEEIGDLCDKTYGGRDTNGGNVVLNGDEYYVQAMWSNQDNGCVLSLGGDVLQPSS